IPERLAISKRMGADITINLREKNPVDEIMKITDGKGVDVAIEALGTQQTFESCLRVLKPGGVLSSLGVYSGQRTVPGDAFASGLADQAIITTLCPGGKERMRRLLNVVASGRVDLKPLVTHRFKLDQIEEAYDLFANARDGVLKIAITP
ncbi:MAG: zinc-binding dehydrogenase, partial [Oxalobacter sp.]|nr:zinc-binding dehydrogenase [Oxalobacter sp.]